VRQTQGEQLRPIAVAHDAVRQLRRHVVGDLVVW
jgi:hypothetical protein